MSRLSRAELYSTDSNGNPIRSVDKYAIGYTVMPVKETPRHALSTPLEEREERIAREGETAAQLALLTDEERRILHIQSRRWMEPREVQVPVDQLASMLDEGWMLVRQENGTAIISGDFAMSPTYEDIAHETGLSVHQVHRRVKSAHKKLRSRH